MRSSISELYQVVHNFVDYPLRQFFHWQRKGYHITPESKDDLFADLTGNQRREAESRERHLREQIHLQEYYEHSSVRGYRETCYYVEMLETALRRQSLSLPSPVCAADIGPSNWFYVPGLAALLHWYDSSESRSIQLTGFEPDAFQIQADLYSRYDHAQANLKGLEGVTYLPQAFSPSPKTYDLITLFFPFVFLHDHLGWGLPKGMFDPIGLLGAAWNSLKSGGILMIANQGRAEHEQERKNMTDLGIPVLDAFRFDSSFFSYPEERYLLVSRYDR